MRECPTETQVGRKRTRPRWIVYHQTTVFDTKPNLPTLLRSSDNLKRCFTHRHVSRNRKCNSVNILEREAERHYLVGIRRARIPEPCLEGIRLISPAAVVVHDLAESAEVVRLPAEVRNHLVDRHLPQRTEDRQGTMSFQCCSRRRAASAAPFAPSALLGSTGNL